MGSLIVLDIPGMYALKPRFQGLLRPFVRVLAAHRVHANQVTVAASAMSIAVGLALAISQDSRWYLALPVVLIARMALNAIDGMLAREFDQRTALGAYLNELTDVVSDAFLYVPFTRISGIRPEWMWSAIVLSVIAEMAGTVAAMNGVARRYDGPMGKSDRALAFGAMGLWIGLAGGVPTAIANLFAIAMASLLILTIVNRVRNGLKETEHAAR